MKISLFLAFLLTVASAFAADAMKFVSPDKSTTLVVDKSGRRDIIELQSKIGRDPSERAAPREPRHHAPRILQRATTMASRGVDDDFEDE